MDANSSSWDEDVEDVETAILSHKDPSHSEYDVSFIGRPFRKADSYVVTILEQLSHRQAP
jgi:hypothetical protein